MKPWRGADGQVGGALLFTEIITDEVDARHALTASEQRFRGLFENAAMGIALSESTAPTSSAIPPSPL